MKKTLWVMTGIAAAMTVGLSAAPLAVTRDFPIPGHGSLRLVTPDGWDAESSTRREPPSVTLHLTPETGNSFDIQVTSAVLDAQDRANATAESIKERVQRTATDLLPQSVETVADIREIKGGEVVGYFYGLTDRNPGPGEFKFLTQGTFLTGDVLSAFTVLHRVQTSPDVAQAIRMFTDAKHVK